MARQTKKEFMPYKSSTPHESISDEAKLANWGNMQHKLTAQNLDDVTQDIIFLKTQMEKEKQKIKAITTKLGLLDHLLHDLAKIKIAMEIAATKTDKRLAVLEELLTKTKKLKKKSHTVNEHVFAIATKGHQRKSSHGKSLFFGHFSVS